LKRKFSKILGVGLTLALLVSLLLVAAPVSALSQPTVSLEEEEISVAEEYLITFVLGDQLTVAGDTITIRFPDDTDVPDGALNADSFDVAASPGWVTVGGVTTWDTTPVVAGLVNAGSAVGDEDELTVIFTLEAADELGEGATVRISFLQGTTPIVNPSDPGTYTLEVQTSEEDDYVESASYEIDAPTVGGFVYVYNASNVLLATYGGEDALMNAEAGLHFNRDDCTIEVGEGTYLLAGDLNINGDGLTLVSDAGAEDTIIDADGNGIVIAGDEVTVEGFTIDDADIAIRIGAAEDVTVTNCVMTDATVAGVSIAATVDSNATISDNVIEDCATGIVFEPGAPTDLGDVDITGNTITGADTNGAIAFAGGNVDIDITGNIITENECSGIHFANGAQTSSDIDITGNTITLNETSGIEIIEPTAANAPTDLIITGNDISANEEDGIVVASWDEALSYLMFNNIYDNDDDAVDNNCLLDEEINAYFNWWGTAVEDDFEDELEGDVNYEPWLMGEQATIVSGYAVAVDDAALDGRDDAGVNVSSLDDDAGLDADIICAFEYAANPEDDIDDAIAFYDLFMVVDGIGDLGEVNAKIKLYDDAITEASTAYFWTGDFWAVCSDQEARNGIIYVDLTEDTLPTFEDLEATPFAVVAGEVEEDVFAAPAIAAPLLGAKDVSIRPTFAWLEVTDAIGYEFVLADNPNFVLPLVKLEGELGRLVVPFYQHMSKLDYSSSYYWKVRAISADDESNWTPGVFITIDEPEEPIPPVVIEPSPTPVIKPIVEVITPPATPITPSWIYVIIGVGAVLVIALLVLIVRTRRVA